MKTLLALLVLTVAALAQSGDDQRDLGRKLTQAELDLLAKRLLQHQTRDLMNPELLNLRNMLQYLEHSKNPEVQQFKDLMPKNVAELKALEQDPKKFMEKIPKGLLEAAEKQGLPQTNPYREPSPPPLPKGDAIEQPRRELPPAPHLHNGRQPTTPLNLQNNPAVRNLVRLWEKNMGPLEKTPALKKAFAELLQSGMAGGGSSPGLFNDDSLNSLIDPNTVFGQEVADWLDKAANGSSWKWSDLGLGDLNFSMPETGIPTGGGGISSPGDSSGSASLLTPLLALAALALVVAVLRSYGLIGPTKRDGSMAAARTLLDPGVVQDRESLIAAFEHCSLTKFGDDARVWNHRTIAEALAQLLTISHDTAAEAARLYELARYSPPEEALSPESYLQARRCLALLGEAASR